MTREEFAERAIKEMADDVRAKIANGRIYGVPIDMNNVDHLIAATYGYATGIMLEERMKERELLRS